MAASALSAARALGFPHPLATCLETVVIVAAAVHVPPPAELGTLLGHADEIRRRGERPGVRSLQAGLRDTRSALASRGPRMTDTDAARLAFDVIAGIDAVS
jgi:hypothetical protein